MKLEAKIGRLKLRMRFADEHYGWPSFVGCELGLAIAAFFGDADGRKIIRVDDAGSSR